MNELVNMLKELKDKILEIRKYIISKVNCGQVPVMMCFASFSDMCAYRKICYELYSMYERISSLIKGLEESK